MAIGMGNIVSTGIDAVLEATKWVIALFGYPGIIFAMAIESACIPLPSEVIMPFAGYLISEDRFNVPLVNNDFVDLFVVGIMGAIGCVVGSVLAYWVGWKGGRPLVERWGRYILVSKRDLDFIDKVFNRYGMVTVFLTRMMPVVRTFISLPAGISRMPFKKFVIYTFTGSLPWCFLLAWIGYIVGNSKKISEWFHRIDLVIIAIGLVACLVLLYFKRKEIVIWFYLVFMRRDIEEEGSDKSKDKNSR